jgi:hypothetical protein
MVLLPILPIFISIIYYWPSNWRSGFYNMFCTGIENYRPYPNRPSSQELDVTKPDDDTKQQANHHPVA